MKQVLAVLIVGCTAALSPSIARARIKTTAQVFHAFDAAGRPKLATRPKRGSCFSGSNAASRNDAWRCTVGNFIYDPCFSSPRAPGVVLCPGEELRFAIKVNLTKGLPRRYANSRPPALDEQPWNLQLLDGEHCIFLTGATSVLQGRRLNYACERSHTTALWGLPNRGTQPWSIFSAPFMATTLRDHRLIRWAWM